MSESEWDKFFELMDKIIRDGRPWKDKAKEVKERAERSEADFEEFVGWFGGNTEEPDSLVKDRPGKD